MILCEGEVAKVRISCDGEDETAKVRMRRSETNVGCALDNVAAPSVLAKLNYYVLNIY